MKNYKKLVFSFGGGLLWFDKATFFTLIVSDEQIVLEEKIFNNDKKFIKTYTYNPNPRILSTFNYFAFKTKIPLPPAGFATDIAYPTISKILHDGEEKTVYFKKEDIKFILLSFIPKELVNKIYK